MLKYKVSAAVSISDGVELKAKIIEAKRRYCIVGKIINNPKCNIYDQKLYSC